MNNFGSIAIYLSKGSFVPGKQVDGIIALNLVQPLPQGGQVLLTIRGLEENMLVHRYTVRRTSGFGKNRRTRTVTKYSNIPGNHVFFNHAFPVYNGGGGFLSPGQYSFPFNFILMANLPSTFNHTFKMHSRDSFARVNYTLMATAVAPGYPQPLLATAQPMMVNQAAIINSGMKQATITKEVSSCCCSKGTLSMATYFEKSEYFPAETAYMIAEINNSNCKADIKTIKGRLVQSIKLTAQGKSGLCETTIQMQELAGLVSGDSKMGPNALRLQLPLKNMNGMGVQPTCRGTTVVNEYILLCEVEMDTCNCGDPNPNISLTLNVRNPEPEDFRPAPTNWNGQMMSPYTANFDAVPLQPIPLLPPAPTVKMDGDDDDDGDGDDEEVENAMTPSPIHIKQAAPNNGGQMNNGVQVFPQRP